MLFGSGRVRWALKSPAAGLLQEVTGDREAATQRDRVRDLLVGGGQEPQAVKIGGVSEGCGEALGVVLDRADFGEVARGEASRSVEDMRGLLETVVDEQGEELGSGGAREGPRPVSTAGTDPAVRARAGRSVGGVAGRGRPAPSGGWEGRGAAHGAPRPVWCPGRRRGSPNGRGEGGAARPPGGHRTDSRHPGGRVNPCPGRARLGLRRPEFWAAAWGDALAGSGPGLAPPSGRAAARWMGAVCGQVTARHVRARGRCCLPPGWGRHSGPFVVVAGDAGRWARRCPATGGVGGRAVGELRLAGGGRLSGGGCRGAGGREVGGARCPGDGVAVVGGALNGPGEVAADLGQDRVRGVG